MFNTSPEPPERLGLTFSPNPFSMPLQILVIVEAAAVQPNIHARRFIGLQPVRKRRYANGPRNPQPLHFDRVLIAKIEPGTLLQAD